MSARTRVAAYALVLVAAFGAGMGLGVAVGPLDRDEPPADHRDRPDTEHR